MLHQAGFTPHEIAPINDKTIVSFGYGLTTAVARATNRADELKKEEFENAIEAFKTKMTLYNPKYIAFLLFSQIHPPSIMQSDMLPLSMIKGCINIIRLAGRSGCILRWI
ncbi:hypothetical protein [[Flexibacter] sp. ATCC 35208]|uniref:hypothetical protein n=1 Tax=[Flexibacter] sp. ATCC 35208 TaxID=1936242 RepID=UPI0009CEDF9F|nr:hypothetical protein [[Flexibacter] sp. ATCC 35208]OMP79117.1 hypothetical protein BW716_10880 [[Flexibacter] sp. ATCC 35208]